MFLRTLVQLFFLCSSVTFLGAMDQAKIESKLNKCARSFKLFEDKNGNKCVIILPETTQALIELEPCVVEPGKNAYVCAILAALDRLDKLSQVEKDAAWSIAQESTPSNPAEFQQFTVGLNALQLNKKTIAIIMDFDEISRYGFLTPIIAQNVINAPRQYAHTNMRVKMAFNQLPPERIRKPYLYDPSLFLNT